MRANLGQIADFDGALTVIGAAVGLQTAHSIPEVGRLALVFDRRIMGGFPDWEVRSKIPGGRYRLQGGVELFFGVIDGITIYINGGAIANGIS